MVIYYSICTFWKDVDRPWVSGLDTIPLYQYLRTSCTNPASELVANKHNLLWSPVSQSDISGNFGLYNTWWICTFLIIWLRHGLPTIFANFFPWSRKVSRWRKRNCEISLSEQIWSSRPSNGYSQVDAGVNCCCQTQLVQYLGRILWSYSWKQCNHLSHNLRISAVGSIGDSFLKIQ